MENNELRLYKLLTENDYVSEMGWVSDTEFYVWVSHVWIHDFIKKLKDIFGSGIFCDDIQAHIQEYTICFNLCDIADGNGVDLETVFPKSEYKH